AEPHDSELFDLIVKHYDTIHFSDPVPEKPAEEKKINPKRMQREIHRHVISSGAGTKAQQAIKMEQEKRAAEKKLLHKETRERKQEIKFEIKQRKRKDKKRGH
ncbi:MAG: YjdF family protein, partial [Spirochaetota bacterium]